MLRYVSSLVYYILYWKMIDRLFFVLPIPSGLLSNCFQLFALGLGLAGCLALGNFTANKVKKQTWWTQS